MRRASIMIKSAKGVPYLRSVRQCKSLYIALEEKDWIAAAKVSKKLFALLQGVPKNHIDTERGLDEVTATVARSMLLTKDEWYPTVLPAMISGDERLFAVHVWAHALHWKTPYQTIVERHRWWMPRHSAYDVEQEAVEIRLKLRTLKIVSFYN